MQRKTKAVPLAVLRLLAKWAIQSARIVKQSNDCIDHHTTGADSNEVATKPEISTV